MSSEMRTIARLKGEFYKWQNEPMEGFVAEPRLNRDKSVDLMTWDCVIPGEVGTIWEGGRYKMRMYFGDDYPETPPQCVFHPPIFHPNLYRGGMICTGALMEYESWDPNMSIKMILTTLQKLLNTPDPHFITNIEAAVIYKKSKEEYLERAKEHIAAMKATPSS